MTTYTWDANPNAPTADWTDTQQWSVDDTSVDTFPTPGNFAEIGVGTVDLDLPELSNVGVTLFQPAHPAALDDVVLVAAGVDLADGTQLATAAIPSNFGAMVYDVVGSGTLDPTAAIDCAAAPLTIELSALSQTQTTATFTSDGMIGGNALSIVAGAGTTAASLVNDATIDMTGPLTLPAGATLAGNGLVNLDGSTASVLLDGAVSTGQTFDIVNVPHDDVFTDTLTIGTLAQFQGTVDLTRESQIVLPGMVSGEMSYAGGVLTFDNGSTLNVVPSQDAAAIGVVTIPATFSGPGETILYGAPPPPCFCAGTRIATPGGETPVERLRAGDTVWLARGGVAQVAWVGQRGVQCGRHPRPQDIRPVCIRAGAVAAGVPARDLWLSPDHAVSVAGHLVPVRHLVNGASIVQPPAMVAHYHHVELARHDLLLAEGLAAESYLDTGNRGAFSGGGPAIELHPEFSRRVWAQAGCARLVESGPALAKARRAVLRQATRLGFRRTSDPALRVLADGREVAPATGGWQFALPDGTRTMRLVSRTWLPEGDGRQLGVALRRLWLDGREASLDSAGLAEGWHAPEATWRWTDGDAALDIAGVRTLGFTLAMVGKYWRSPARARPSAVSALSP